MRKSLVWFGILCMIAGGILSIIINLAHGQLATKTPNETAAQLQSCGVCQSLANNLGMKYEDNGTAGVKACIKLGQGTVGTILLHSGPTVIAHMIEKGFVCNPLEGR